MRIRRIGRALPLLAAVAVLLVGCSGGVSPGPTPSLASPSVVSPRAASPSVTKAPARISPAVNTAVTLTVDGLARRFLVRAPAHPVGEVLPVVIALHGAGGNAAQFARVARFGADTAAKRFIAVFPDGTELFGDSLGWNAGTCCGQPQEKKVDDIGFLRDTIATVEKRYGGDPRRIYVAGFSNGGMLAYRAACDLGSEIAGIAVVSGALNVTSCRSTSPIPLLIMHGTKDPVVPYDGGNPIDVAQYGLKPWINASVADAVRAWTARDGCGATPVTRATKTGTDARYATCADGTFVDVRTIRGGGHTWPGNATTLIEKAFLVGQD